MAQYVIDNIASPINFQGTDEVTRVLQNANNLLMCSMGEVPYDRLRGFDAKLYDLPLEQFRDELMPELDALMAYEPRASVMSAKASLMQNNQIYIQATVEVLNS